MKRSFDTAYLPLETSDKGVTSSFSLAFDKLPGFEELWSYGEVVAIILDKVDYLDGSLKKAKMCLWQKNSCSVPQS